MKWVEAGFVLSLPHLHGDLPRVASLLPGLAQMSSFPRTDSRVVDCLIPNNPCPQG